MTGADDMEIFQNEIQHYRSSRTASATKCSTMIGQIFSIGPRGVRPEPRHEGGTYDRVCEGNDDGRIEPVAAGWAVGNRKSNCQVG